MISNKPVDYRKTKTTQKAFKQVEKQINREKNLDRKISLWKKFIIENIKTISGNERKEQKLFIEKARKSIETLKLEKTRRVLKPKRRFLDFFFNPEKRFERHCAMFNLSLNYSAKTNEPYGVMPYRVVEVDYDNVTFNLLFKTQSEKAAHYFVNIELVAKDEKEAIIGTISDFLLPISHPGQVVKKVYVPNSAKDAYRFYMTVSFAKNKSI